MEIKIEQLDIKYKHFNIMCRICLKKDYQLTSIFTKEANETIENSQISEMIELCTGLKVSLEDKFPQNLCTDCLKELKECYQFRDKCIKAQDILENVMNCHKIQINGEGAEDSLYYSNEYVEMDNEINYNSQSESETECKIKKELNEIKEELDIHNIKNTKLLKTKSCKISKKLNSQKEKQKTAKQCQICGKLYNCLRGHIRKVHHNRFKCQICNKTRPTLEGLHKHMNTHQTEYTCEYCNKTYVDKRRMLEHQAVQHLRDKKYQCNKCDKEFFILRSLKKHETTHGEPYTCNICQKQISTKDNLRYHMQIHTGEKRYKCEFCSKAFLRSQTLKDHRRIHTQERPFVCSHCGSTFTQKSSLNLHLKKFHTKSSLQE